MKKIIKILSVFFVCIISILMLCTGVCAEDNEYEVSDSLVSASGADNITDDLSSDVQSILEKYDIRADNPNSVDSFGVGEILEYIYDIASLKLASPLRTFFTLTAVIVFTAFMESSKGGLKGGTEHISGLITAMAGASAVIPDVCSCFLRVRETISQSSDFMISFTPVFAGIIITSGSPGAGMCYNMTVYAVVNIIIQIIDKALLPVLSMCLALSITDAVIRNGSTGGLQRFMKTIVTWTLGFLMTVFTGVLSVQGIVKGTADTFASKTAKYVVSNFVPFVGGAVSDAYGTVLGSLKILKSCTGFVGIVTLCILLLPVLLELMLYRLAVSGAAAIGEIFGSDSMVRLLRGVEISLKMTFAVLVCFSVMFIVAIAVVLLMTGSAGG